MSFLRFVLFVFILFFFNSCEDGCCEDEFKSAKTQRIFGAVQPPKSCDKISRKTFVYDLLHDSYLWADDTAFVNFKDDTLYPDETALLNELKNEKDRFSFIISQNEYEEFFIAGRSVGFGFSFVFIGDEQSIDSMRIILVYPDSPAYKSTLKRSDVIVAIDGYRIDEIYKNEKLFKKYFGFEGEFEAVFTIRKKDGALEKLNIAKTEFAVKSVIKKEVLNIDGKKIGYLLFQSFTGNAKSELKNAFSYFKEKNIDELVLDLRYNGGGYVYFANLLSSLIAGKNAQGKVFMKRVFNEKYSSYDMTDYFLKEQKEALDLSRLFILTTKSSCSASELVINSLRASTSGVDVVQIGDRTCGKPYGMIGGAYCGRYILPVQMKNLNGDGIGEYINGLSPDCIAKDDFWHDFGDENESLLKSAFYYISKGSCLDMKKPKKVLKIRFGDNEDSFRRRFNVF